MSKLIIRKMCHVQHGHTEYELASEGVATCCLTWDEMLGGIARAFLREYFIGLPEERTKFRVERDGWEIEYELQIENVGNRGDYLITQGEGFVSYLSFDEMLGFIAQYTLMEKQIFGGLRTYSEWAQAPFHKREITGLLPEPTVL